MRANRQQLVLNNGEGLSKKINKYKNENAQDFSLSYYQLTHDIDKSTLLPHSKLLSEAFIITQNMQAVLLSIRWIQA